MLKYYVGIDIFQTNTLEMIFIYYFIGSVISRIGSLVLGELLKKVKFIRYSSHKDYIEAAKQDKVIEKLLDKVDFNIHDYIPEYISNNIKADKLFMESYAINNKFKFR